MRIKRSGSSSRPDFFLPVGVLSEVFPGKLLAKLEHALARAKIPADREHATQDRLKRAAAKRWVVYCKPPFAGPDQVLTRFLGDARIPLDNKNRGSVICPLAETTVFNNDPLWRPCPRIIRPAAARAPR